LIFAVVDSVESYPNSTNRNKFEAPLYGANAARCKGYKGPETLFSTLRG